MGAGVIPAFCYVQKMTKTTILWLIIPYTYLIINILEKFERPLR